MKDNREKFLRERVRAILMDLLMKFTSPEEGGKGFAKVESTVDELINIIKLSSKS